MQAKQQHNGDKMNVLNVSHVNAKKVDQFDLLTEAYEGSGGFYYGNYLYEGVREHPKNYSVRCSKVVYDNILSRVIEGK